MELFQQAWEALGTEVAEFGLRWIVVGLFAFAFGGFFGRRWRSMKRDINELRQRAGSINQSVSVNIPPNEDDSAYDFRRLKNPVGEYDDAMKVLLVATKAGPRRIRFDDQRNTMEDIYATLSKNRVLVELDPEGLAVLTSGSAKGRWGRQTAYNQFMRVTRRSLGLAQTYNFKLLVLVHLHSVASSIQHRGGNRLPMPGCWGE